MSQRHHAGLVTDASTPRSPPVEGHDASHDLPHRQGAEYTSAACQDHQRLGLGQSMGRTGSCLDNAVAESFFATLKVELVGRCHYRTRAQARASIFRWIAWYPQRRLHSTNHYLPPLEWEQRHHHDHPPPSTLAASPRCSAGGGKSNAGMGV
jgi:putative transposase